MAPEIRSCSFRGGVARSGPLSWAQGYMWRALNLPGNGSNMDHLFSVRVRTPISVDTAVACLGRLIERHATLRTCVVADPGGRVRQRVLDSGSVPVHVIDVPRGLLHAEITAALPLISGSPPIQALVVVTAGRVTNVAMRLSHIVSDEWGVRLIKEDLAAELADPLAQTTRPREKTSVDLAEYESSQAGRTASDRALEYVTGQLATSPQTMFAHRPAGPAQPRYWNVELQSKALLMALARLRTEQRLMLSAPVIGTFAAIMAVRAALPAALIYVMSNNRTAPWRDFSGPLLQEAPLCIPVSRAGCAGIVRSINVLVFNAYQRGRHDPAAVARRVEEIELERGVSIDKLARTATVNIHPQPLDRVGESCSLAELRSMARVSTFTRTPRADIDNVSFFLDVVVGASCLVLAARVDTALVSLAETEAILAAMEKIVCELTEGDVEVSDIPRLGPGIGRDIAARTTIVDGSRVAAADCADVLMTHPDVAAAHVRVDQGVITAYVHARARDLDPARLHRFVVGALPRYPLAMAPHLYRIYYRGELLAAGTGRSAADPQRLGRPAAAGQQGLQE
jgi:Condensation domain